MAINFDKFLSWAESRWDGDIVVKGNEVKLNSIFCEDHKHHLWCNPAGGKQERPQGVFRCWKTDKRGSLITLVMLRDKCTYEEALEILDTGDTSLAELEKKLENIMGQEPAEEIPIGERGLEFPEQTYLIRDLSDSNFFRVSAEVYMLGRGLSSQGLYVCCGGECRNRIIIPYYDRDDNLIYWNGRYLGKSSRVPKYQGPEKTLIGKGDVVYMVRWPKAWSKVHLTEGEFDAMTLTTTGLNGGAIGGKSLGESQVELLRPYEVVLCLDNDLAGKSALWQIGHDLVQRHFNVSYTNPPKEYKDWNEMLGIIDPILIKAYIERTEKSFDDQKDIEMRFDSIKPKRIRY